MALETEDGGNHTPTTIGWLWSRLKASARNGPRLSSALKIQPGSELYHADLARRR